LLIIPLMPRPLFYMQPPIRDTVVDDRGKSVAGTVVVAIWRAEEGWFQAHGARPLDRQMAITDDKGEFTLPGWTRRWNAWGLNRRVLKTDQPEIVMYKFGYVPTLVVNNLKNTSKSLLIWQIEGPLVLKTLTGSPTDAYKAFSDHVGVLNPTMPSLFIGCEWQKFKPLFVEFDKQEQVAEQLGLIVRLEGEPVRPWYAKAEDNFKLQFPDRKPDCPGATEWLESERLKRKNGMSSD